MKDRWFLPRSHSASYVICSIMGQKTGTSAAFFLCVGVRRDPERAHGPSGRGTDSPRPHICLSRYPVSCLHPHNPRPGHKSSSRPGFWARNVAPCTLSLNWSLSSPGAFWACSHPVLQSCLLPAVTIQIAPKKTASCRKLKTQSAGTLCANAQKKKETEDLCVC